jgi:uncharacterized protein (TIGR00369 family)
MRKAARFTNGHGENAMPDTQGDNRALWLEQEKAVRSRLNAQPTPVPLTVLAQRSGLELLRGVMTGQLPPPPIGTTLDFFLVEVESGRAVFQGNPKAAFYNPIGSVHGGWASTLLDSCVACAVHSTLPAGKGYTTIELKVNFVRPVMPDSGPMRAEGKVINVGNRIGTAEGRLTDAAGKLYAHATTTCLIFDMAGK